jgi:uroporphyrinogen-III decarboxylase
MTPNERIIRTLEGKPVDRVPVMCAGLEDRTVNEVFGKPLIPGKMLFRNPLMKHVMNNYHGLSNFIAHTAINSGMDKHTQAAIKFGFDAMWLLSGENMMISDYDTLANINGMIYNLIDDGFGNMTYMYRCPGITSKEAFESWPFFVKPDDYAAKTYSFFNKMVKKHGESICFMGCACSGIQESMLCAVGFERMPVWIRKEKELTRRYIDWCSELIFKGTMAVLDAGVKVILQGDDFAYKTGPVFSPKVLDELFGPYYTRIIKAVHDRGAKIMLHSCGDNTVLFDMFIKWGFDGFHAYETTSTVDIFKEKTVHGQSKTIMGGVGVDYLLTDRSKEEEIVDEVRRLIRRLGPGDRFILAPGHSLSSIPASKMKLMVETARMYGTYPIGEA